MENTREVMERLRPEGFQRQKNSHLSTIMGTYLARDCIKVGAFVALTHSTTRSRLEVVHQWSFVVISAVGCGFWCSCRPITIQFCLLRFAHCIIILSKALLPAGLLCHPQLNRSSICLFNFVYRLRHAEVEDKSWSLYGERLQIGAERETCLSKPLLPAGEPKNVPSALQHAEQARAPTKGRQVSQDHQKRMHSSKGWTAVMEPKHHAYGS